MARTALSPRTRNVLVLVAAVLVLGLWWWAGGADDPPPQARETPSQVATPRSPGTPSGAPSGTSSGIRVAFGALPREAQETVRLVQRGGPFPYDRDGVVFENREGLLPHHERGYYHEYTVPTPGSADRGARRLVTAGKSLTHPEAWYYSDDHYRSFREVTGVD